MSEPTLAEVQRARSQAAAAFLVHEQAVRDAITLAEAIAALQRVLTGSSNLRRNLLLTMDSAHGRACYLVKITAQRHAEAVRERNRVRDLTYAGGGA